MEKGKVEIKIGNKTYRGFWNGKTYSDAIYVGGTKIKVSDITASGNIVAEMYDKETVVYGASLHLARGGLCPLCHTYCCGDCS